MPDSEATAKGEKTVAKEIVSKALTPIQPIVENWLVGFSSLSLGSFPVSPGEFLQFRFSSIFPHVPVTTALESSGLNSQMANSSYFSLGFYSQNKLGFKLTQ